MTLQYIYGAVVMANLVVALFFLRFWKATSDRFFGIFSLAFFLFAIERLALASVPVRNEASSLVYLVRLSAFLVILWAIIDKNRASQS